MWCLFHFGAGQLFDRMVQDQSGQFGFQWKAVQSGAVWIGFVYLHWAKATSTQMERHWGTFAYLLAILSHFFPNQPHTHEPTLNQTHYTLAVKHIDGNLVMESNLHGSCCEGNGLHSDVNCSMYVGTEFV